MKEYELIILGGGPAGMTAGIYACRYGLSTLLVENYFCGGQMNLTTEIKNYPSYEYVSGIDLSDKMKKHYLSCQGELLLGNPTNIDFDKKEINIKGEVYSYKALILAMGATARKLNLEKEQELTGHGISYCAICDGFFFKGKDVVVAGSGNSALEDAIYLSNICKSVTIVSKHTEFRAQDIFIKDLEKKKNVTYYMGYQTSKIIGEESLSAIEITSNSSGEVKEIKTDGLFIQIGRRPDISLVKDKVECNPAGFIKATEEMETNIKGVFVAGDIREKTLRQIITACADGAIASNSAFKYIDGLK